MRRSPTSFSTAFRSTSGVRDEKPSSKFGVSSFMGVLIADIAPGENNGSEPSHRDGRWNLAKWVAMGGGTRIIHGHTIKSNQ